MIRREHVLQSAAIICHFRSCRFTRLLIIDNRQRLRERSSIVLRGYFVEKIIERNVML